MKTFWLEHKKTGWCRKAPPGLRNWSRLVGELEVNHDFSDMKSRLPIASKPQKKGFICVFINLARTSPLSIVAQFGFPNFANLNNTWTRWIWNKRFVISVQTQSRKTCRWSDKKMGRHKSDDPKPIMAWQRLHKRTRSVCSVTWNCRHVYHRYFRATIDCVAFHYP